MADSETKEPLNGGSTNNGSKPRKSNFRSYSSQIVASTVKNFLLFDIGLCGAFPAIVIPALHHNTSETIQLTEEQISWFGSIAFICQPLGSVFSGWITEPLGRKRAMFFVNIPFIVAWLMMYFATTSTHIFFSTILMGLGVGFMEAAILTYVGEISEPAIRGILTSCANISVTLGFFVTYYLGSVVSWRTAALICLSVPVSTAVAICFVPETPLWLLSKGRKADALKSLQWLRGWTTEEEVKAEFRELEMHHEKSSKCRPCTKADIPCAHNRSSFSARMRGMLNAGTLKPFFIVTTVAMISHLGGLTGFRQYYIQIYETYDIPMPAADATVIVGFIGLVGNVALMFTLRLVGKRRMCLMCLFVVGSLWLWLGYYAKTTLPPGQTSFDRTNPTKKEGKGLIPMIIFFVNAFVFNLGIYGIPWMLVSEIFPFKSRGLATGISAALNYVFAFIATKTYLNVERGFGMHGTAWFYACFALGGFVILYFILPETEELKLEEIEDHFMTKGRPITDIKIKRFVSIEKPLLTTDS